MKKANLKRILEIIPGVMSWSIILSSILLFKFNPVMAAIALIVYLIYWSCRLFYMSTLLFMAHHRMLSKKSVDWYKLCEASESDKSLAQIVHVVLYTIYKEPESILIESLNAVKTGNYPKENIIVVLAGEERGEGTREKLENLKTKFQGDFKDILLSIHPSGIQGEIPCKGANATYAAKRVKTYLEQKTIDFGNVIISCFDADTCPDRNYFSCLTYHFLTNPNRYRTGYQPLPIYSNNIFTAPAFARVIEMGSTFWQLIESMKANAFVTFASYGMSFKTLVDVDYWPVNLVSDDSLIYWKCFVKFNGDYTTYSLEVPVFMDIAVGKNILDTILVQYKQKRRWAWGVETFVFLGMHLWGNRSIPLSLKVKKVFQILDNHINWATWAILISFITPLLLCWGKWVRQDSLVFLNLTYINSTLVNSFTLILLLCIFIGKEFLPPRPPKVSRFIYVSFILQWFLTPLVSAFLGSIPALDAQTRLMIQKPLVFDPTPKQRLTEGPEEKVPGNLRRKK
ncbi:MAG: glycosyltransferase family 2 protein [Candidatus Omnitrophica bacterium]|nr:glycosyltransferase family 2 protein [Candidatus Omnitrophota bacterium]MDD5670685.1 glycosyltransferase family 2 protein [Candidatus Omnitrophota bacterium]